MSGQNLVGRSQSSLLRKHKKNQDRSTSIQYQHFNAHSNNLQIHGKKLAITNSTLALHAVRVV